jgi:hypothetical protein
MVPARLACLLCLPVGLLVLAAGCGKKEAYDTAEVTGRVLFNGEPLPGGRVTFVAVKGGTAVPGTIDEKGNYKVQAPVGEVQISVDNSGLDPLKGGRMGSRSLPPLKRPGQKEPETLKGTYVPIPNKYYDPTKSGLTYTVKSESQKHDIELKE